MGKREVLAGHTYVLLLSGRGGCVALYIQAAVVRDGRVKSESVQGLALVRRAWWGQQLGMLNPPTTLVLTNLQSG
jgi:hypothetical protein